MQRMWRVMDVVSVDGGRASGCDRLVFLGNNFSPPNIFISGKWQSGGKKKKTSKFFVRRARVREVALCFGGGQRVRGTRKMSTVLSFPFHWWHGSNTEQHDRRPPPGGPPHSFPLLPPTAKKDAGPPRLPKFASRQNNSNRREEKNAGGSPKRRVMTRASLT